MDTVFVMHSLLVQLLNLFLQRKPRSTLLHRCFANAQVVYCHDKETLTLLHRCFAGLAFMQPQALEFWASYRCLAFWLWKIEAFVNSTTGSGSTVSCLFQKTLTVFFIILFFPFGKSNNMHY